MVQPFQRIYDLSDLSSAGKDVAVAAKDDELAQLAQSTGVDAVTRFDAKIALRKLAQNRFTYEADLDADVVQACVVTLEPVKSHIERHFSRALHLTRGPASARGEVIVSPTDDDSPEEIASSRYDLVGPLLEELVLAIDPYPRAAGVAFEPPAEEKVAEDSPFAVLKQLKRDG